MLIRKQHVEVCKLCFTGKYHDHHDFIMRQAPDKDWEPAHRGNNASHYNEEYQRIMRELQSREIRPEDYELLLSLESASTAVALPKYLAVSFERMLPPEKKAAIENMRDTPPCNFCSGRIESPATAMILRNCDHFLHKGCLEDMFRLKKTKCPTCEAVIAEGFEKSLQIIKPRKPKKHKAKQQLEEVKQKVL